MFFQLANASKPKQIQKIAKAETDDIEAVIPRERLCIL